MLPALPVLAAGVVGICLGTTATALWSRGRPVVPLAKVRAWKEDLLRDWHEAHVQAVDAHDTVNVLAAQRDELRAAMFVLAQELSDERHARGAAELRAAAAEEQVDALEMGLGEAA